MLLLLLPSISAGTDRPTGHRFNLSALFFITAWSLSCCPCCFAAAPKVFRSFLFCGKYFQRVCVCAVWLLCAEIVHFFVALTLLLLVLTFVLSLLKLAPTPDSQSSESNAHTRGQLLQLNCLIRATASAAAEAALISDCSSCCFCCCRRSWPLAVILWHHHHHC